MTEECFEIKDKILSNFPFDPTEGQEKAATFLARFLISEKLNCCFLLKGYAGTGKTSLISALVRFLKGQKQKTILMAPTGRAAKVFSHYSGQQAFTIHKTIYALIVRSDGSSVFTLRENTFKNVVFIVDEASMISDQSGLLGKQWHKSSLLDDLMNYVFSGKNCRLILLGDTAQLPPVHLDHSPALDTKNLKASYQCTLGNLELDEVLRQKKHSGILNNATYLRHALKREQVSLPLLEESPYTDVLHIDSFQFQDELESAFRQYGDENVLVITRSNKSSNMYNQQIRHVVFGREEELEAGDKIMVVKNNYFWLKDDKHASYVANGDMAEVLSIQRIEELFEFKFADVNIRLLDYDHAPEISVKLLLNSIYINGPALSKTERDKLYLNVSADYEYLGDKRLIYQALDKDPYFNALEVKFGYSVTCHKSQGGQWPIVFIDLGYFTEEMLDKNLVRWLYTAITRASEKVYLVNFPKEFFNSSGP